MRRYSKAPGSSRAHIGPSSEVLTLTWGLTRGTHAKAADKRPVQRFCLLCGIIAAFRDITEDAAFIVNSTTVEFSLFTQRHECMNLDCISGSCLLATSPFLLDRGGQQKAPFGEKREGECALLCRCCAVCCYKSKPESISTALTGREI